MNKDYEAAAEWAEHDMVVSKDHPSTLHGDAAAQFGRDLLRRAGRPALDPATNAGEHSPRRQVRMPHELSEQIDDLAHVRGTSASLVMREALTEYVARHRSELV